MEQDKEYVFTDKDTKNWHKAKSQMPTERKKLSKAEINIFLKLICSLSSPVLFQRKLGLSAREVELYKQELNVPDQESARKLLKKLEQAEEVETFKRIEAARLESIARAEEVDKRLSVSGLEPKLKKPKKLSADRIKKEDQKRQRRLEKQEQKAAAKSDFRCENATQFEKDLSYGMNFCCTKYDVKPSDIYAEINRLKIEINIETIRR